MIHLGFDASPSVGPAVGTQLGLVDGGDSGTITFMDFGFGGEVRCFTGNDQNDGTPFEIANMVGFVWSNGGVFTPPQSGTLVVP